MAPKPRTYYQDDSASDVKGIIVLEVGDGEFRVTENYEDTHWCKPFWMPEQEFRAHTHGDSIEEVGIVSEDKTDKVLNIAEA